MNAYSDKNNIRQTFYTLRDKGEKIRFEDVGDFVQWSLENGYEYGRKLVRLNPNEAWSPDNCMWDDRTYTPKRQRLRMELALQWDKFIGPIRERFRSLEVPEPEPEPEPERPEREVFRYEHPDLMREGIVWQG